jgi:hypothetical protein
MACISLTNIYLHKIITEDCFTNRQDNTNTILEEENNSCLCNEFLCKLGFSNCPWDKIKVLRPRGHLEKPNLPRNELHTKFYCLKRRP